MTAASMSARRAFRQLLCRGASSSAAGPRKLSLSFGAGCVPKEEGKPGEDAFFASTSLAAFGVADGVGGWSSHGVDAGLFSRALLRNAMESMRHRNAAMHRPDLPAVAVEAYEAVRTSRIRGSCTLLLGQLKNDMFSMLLLGDCGLLALRPSEVMPRFHGGTPTTAMRILYRSSAMLHRPNLPRQLSSEDDDMSGLVDHYDLVSLRLLPGDLLVAGTDGLFDNVGDREIRSFALKHHEEQKTSGASRSSPELMASQITQRAAAAARAPIEFGPGGKLDDIAVVVAEVQDQKTVTAGDLLENVMETS